MCVCAMDETAESLIYSTTTTIPERLSPAEAEGKVAVVVVVVVAAVVTVVPSKQSV